MVSLAQPVDSMTPSAETRTLAPLFAEEEILELKMEMDIPALLADRGEERSYHPARVRGLAMGQAVDQELKVKVRGNFRRQEANCEFPPLKLKFKDTESAGSVFFGQKKIKLVTHCSDDEYILREYLVYKTYNLLTDSSLKVRLARITYHDTQGEVPDETHFGFFIEDDDDLATRHQGTAFKKKRVNTAEIDPDQLLLMHTFMYMIGNRDWDISLGKNVKAFRGNEEDPWVVVPYDFDFCGAVDAPYTYKNILSAGGDLEWRAFRPICQSESDFSETFALFKAKKSEIFALYENFSYLPENSSRKVLKFFEQFYRTIDNPKKVQRVFLDACPDRE